MNGASGEDEVSSGDMLPGLGRASKRGWVAGTDDSVGNMEEASF